MITVLGAEQKDDMWISSLTGTVFRYDPTLGWEGYRDIGGATDWYPVRAGVVTETVYAHTGEDFREVEAS